MSKLMCQVDSKLLRTLQHFLSGNLSAYYRIQELENTKAEFSLKAESIISFPQLPSFRIRKLTLIQEFFHINYYMGWCVDKMSFISTSVALTLTGGLQKSDLFNLGICK